MKTITLFESDLWFLRGCNCCVMSSQAVEWLGELLDALLKTHIRLGDDSQETKVLLEKHKKFVDVAQVFETLKRQLFMFAGDN